MKAIYINGLQLSHRHFALIEELRSGKTLSMFVCKNGRRSARLYDESNVVVNEPRGSTVYSLYRRGVLVKEQESEGQGYILIHLKLHHAFKA